MLKKGVSRAINSFLYSIAINVILSIIIMAAVNKPDYIPIVPDYAARFSSGTMALLVQWILIGFTSAAFGFWSIIMEYERIGLLLQSILYFVLTAIVWIPVAIFCWDLGKNIFSFITIVTSYLISYIVTWTIQYRNCKDSIKQINRKLEELRND
jgi:glucan phosphoethanolaminetransferase (alkaline phosphatase superfamily)